MAIFQHTNDHEMHPFNKAKSYFVLFSICRNFVRKVFFFININVKRNVDSKCGTSKNITEY